MNKPLDDETRARNAGQCKSCGAPIVWAKTPKGKTMPMEPDLVHGGNVKLSCDDAGMLRAEVVRPVGNAEAWVTHFSLCEHAAEHRNEKPEKVAMPPGQAGRIIMPFGKYAGEHLDDVNSSPRGKQYLRWAYENMGALKPEVRRAVGIVIGEEEP